LSWQEVSDGDGRDVSGYNIYRSDTLGGGFDRINTEPVAETQFKDVLKDKETRKKDAPKDKEARKKDVPHDIKGSHHYYYTVSAVDFDGVESAQSQEIRGEMIVEQQRANQSTGSASKGACFINSAGGNLHFPWD